MKVVIKNYLLLLSLFILFSFVSSSMAGPEWLPDGDWALDWSDEFSGDGAVEQWYPMLGYTPGDYTTKTEKGLRWNGKTEDTARMYSTQSGNHWLNGDGQLVIRAVCDKTESNTNGFKVKTAYLMSGYPDHWDKSEPAGVKWAGRFVSPKDGALYISTRVRSDQVVGHSTWFAFWLFSQTRAYNGNPTDGTEVDLIEIAKGAPNYMDHIFNVANHWGKTGGSESKQLNPLTDPPALSFVDVMDVDYHVYGLEWTTKYMKCYVDGQLYYTFIENIPSDPVDMMMLLTMEFQPNAWDPNQGDGRTTGPYVSDTAEMREMSRALVDYVRIYIRSDVSPK
jgi:beta-glucanase (GH16 family)